MLPFCFRKSQATLSSSGLLAWWNFEESSGSFIDEVTGEVLQRGTAQSSSGLLGSSVFFPQSTTTIECATTSGSRFQFTTGDSRTITFWFKLFAPYDSTKSGPHLILLSASPFSSIEATVYFDVVACDVSTLSTVSQAFAPLVATTGLWYFVSCSYDGSTGKTSAKVNAGTEYLSSTSTTVPTTTSVAFKISKSNAADPTNSHVMDMVSVWSRKLTDAEITALYNAGLGRAYPF